MAVKKKAADKKLSIKLLKSINGKKDDHIATALSLGLKKPGDETLQPDNAATRGKVSKISYMVEVNENN